MRLVPAERAALAELFDELGPAAPTVLPGWGASELLAHLLVRERQPLAATGIVVPPLARLARGAMRCYDRMPWSERVALLRSGPPLWSPFWLGGVDERANLVEFVVHRQDLARAQPGWADQPVEAGPPELDEALWSWLRLSARLMYRKSSVGVVLRHPTRRRGDTVNARAGRGVVTLIGAPLELVLHAYGRESARVETDGTPADVAALNATPRGV